MIKNPFRRTAQSPQVRNSILGPMALIATTNSGVGFSVLVWGELTELIQGCVVATILAPILTLCIGFLILIIKHPDKLQPTPIPGIEEEKDKEPTP